MKVFVLGYSLDPQRYSFIAYNLLESYGHEAIGINPTVPEAFNSLLEAMKSKGSPHTITMYIRPELSSKMIDSILEVKPKRVIFNPGTENFFLMKKLQDNHIEVVVDCTLIMLRSGKF